MIGIPNNQLMSGAVIFFLFAGLLGLPCGYSVRSKDMDVIVLVTVGFLFVALLVVAMTLSFLTKSTGLL